MLIRTIRAIAGTICASLLLAAVILIAGPLLILYSLLTGSAEEMYWMGVGAAALALRLCGVRVRTEGLENIPSGVCLFAANHVSNLDPPVVVCVIPRRVALLAKKEVFRVPVLGTALRLARFIPVDRSDRSAAMASVELAKRYMREGMSYLVFPEGTRSPDGRLMRFKSGSILLAIQTGVPIVPVSVIGTQRLMPRGKSLVLPGEVRVVFHPPIATEGTHIEERHALTSRVRDVVCSALPPEQKPA